MSDSSEPDLTFGQRAVGIKFNPGKDDNVTKIKQFYADLIDDVDKLRNGTEDGEIKRLCSISITELQEAQMWHVKAITWEK